eukprot:TRINITY_DN109268_c0_g1_i1.p1 TRINITY_DN109268_c0_g1~~TRINITY_DN109268_c0_g1_i1.p1  ORF type:complete len:752 (+),score=266.21 TRINITY_DN109268_c0_g1_i1:118-2373(+)
MSRLARSMLVVAAGLTVSSADESTPTEKVIEMLNNLKDEVTKEGEAEAATYKEFETFCKDTEASKKDAIDGGETSKANLDATLKDKIGQLDMTNKDIMTKRGEKETFTTQKDENKLQCSKDQTNYDAQDADLTAAVFGLESAIEKLESAKETANAPSLIQRESLVGENIERSLRMAETLGLIEEPKHQAMTAFLQGQPWLDEAGEEHNKEDYAFQSGDIVALLNKLLEEFRTEKNTAAENWGKREDDCNAFAKEKKEAIEAKGKAIEKAEQDADQLSSEIGETKADLLTTTKNLKEDRIYLSELQLNCGNRAADWEQRLKARTGELEAIDTALGVLSKKVKGLDDDVGRNAELLSTSQKTAAPTSFLQVESATSNLLQRGKHRHHHKKKSKKSKKAQRQLVAVQLTSEQQALNSALRDNVVLMLAQAGQRLNSQRLSRLAVRMSAPQNDLSGGNVLVGVKQMIVDLVSKLKDEATAEADKKGSCTTRLNKANFERDHRLSQSNKLDAELKNLEGKRGFLSEEINLLEDTLEKLKTELEEATKIREEEAAENKETIAKSKEGASAVKDALKALKAFYHGVKKDAGKHDKKMDEKAKASELQTSQTPPDAGFSGSYGGKQGAAVGILGMMEVIQADFERTAADTLAADQKAAKEFAEFKSSSNEDIGAKDTTKALSEEDRDSVLGLMGQRQADLQRATDLLDDALEVLEALKPECVDTAESYDDRKAKRDEEIAQLKKALCTLDPNGVEEECK